MDKNEIIDRISRLRTRANLSARALSIKIRMNEDTLIGWNRKEIFHQVLMYY